MDKKEIEKIINQMEKYSDFIGKIMEVVLFKMQLDNVKDIIDPYSDCCSGITGFNRT